MDNAAFFFLIFNLNGKSILLDKLMVFGAEPLIYLFIFFIFILALKGGMKEKKAFLLVLLGIPIAILFIKGIHLFFFENRPFVTYHFTPFVKEIANASFPSRHATIAAILALPYTYLKSKWSIFFLFIMTWIGFSRIYVGVHYPLDVIGGFLVGIVALLVSVKIKDLLRFGFLKKPLQR
ncbi:phosphatase PAP2 family protein [Patescibacteria group bacterium]|nr:phosphatase PAP2 family protein [Patescibacteria group bacterium]